MKAVILAAGFGTRLNPHTIDLPKALIPYKNLPMVNHQIGKLKNIGITEIFINSHHHNEKMSAYFKKYDFKVKINVIVEQDILGTGGGILNMHKFLENEDYFLVINVDVETDMDIQKMVKHHQSEKPFATLAVQKRKSSRYLEFDNNMNLVGRENVTSESDNLYAFNGIHLISGRIFRKSFETGFIDIMDIYFDAVKQKEHVKGYNAGKSSFKDLGKIENLLSD